MEPGKTVAKQDEKIMLWQYFQIFCMPKDQADQSGQERSLGFPEPIDI